ncbi:MAG: hypothetical protein NT016_00150 [Candidatus Aenigmarchaeota archaeon]|nr:hypothetical protein [Candidatus Aenigmarchaeota archaeon]
MRTANPSTARANLLFVCLTALVATHFILPVPAAAAAVTISLKSGWNLMSQPFSTFSIISNTCTLKANLFGYDPVNKIYFAVTSLANTVGANGYWIYVAGDCAITFSGTQQASIPLLQGWNMVGGVDAAGTTANQIKSACSINIPSNPGASIFLYDPSIRTYASATTLAQGRGYWVNVLSPCTVTASGTTTSTTSSTTSTTSTTTTTLLGGQCPVCGGFTGSCWCGTSTFLCSSGSFCCPSRSGLGTPLCYSSQSSCTSGCGVTTTTTTTIPTTTTTTSTTTTTTIPTTTTTTTTSTTTTLPSCTSLTLTPSSGAPHYTVTATVQSSACKVCDYQGCSGGNCIGALIRTGSGTFFAPVPDPGVTKVFGYYTCPGAIYAYITVTAPPTTTTTLASCSWRDDGCGLYGCGSTMGQGYYCGSSTSPSNTRCGSACSLPTCDSSCGTAASVACTCGANTCSSGQYCCASFGSNTGMCTDYSSCFTACGM